MNIIVTFATKKWLIQIEVLPRYHEKADWQKHTKNLAHALTPRYKKRAYARPLRDGGQSLIPLLNYI
ncbi:protein of unknown function [Cyanobium sp. NIES-981]|nr:protein of unknown function [Cyanobium sp. NIES-981]